MQQVQSARVNGPNHTSVVVEPNMFDERLVFPSTSRVSYDLKTGKTPITEPRLLSPDVGNYKNVNKRSSSRVAYSKDAVNRDGLATL